jgi:hypothetical protein
MRVVIPVLKPRCVCVWVVGSLCTINRRENDVNAAVLGIFAIAIQHTLKGWMVIEEFRFFFSLLTQ